MNAFELHAWIQGRVQALNEQPKRHIAQQIQLRELKVIERKSAEVVAECLMFEEQVESDSESLCCDCGLPERILRVVQ